MTIRSTILIAASTLVSATALSAQVSEAQAKPDSKSRWEFRVPTGAMVPTGTLRDAIKKGNLTAVQLSYVARPGLAFTSTVGWGRSRDITTTDNPKLDVFTYDVGAEVRGSGWTAGTATLTPFAGVGAGGRSYDYRKLDLDATHNVAAYGTVGGQLGLGRVRLRLEARDYVSGFKPLAGHAAARTGNDVVVMATLGFAWR